MSSQVSLALAIAVLAVGTYAMRVAGVLLRDRIEVPDQAQRLIPMGAAALLCALAATSAIYQAAQFVGFARPLGVLAGALLAVRRAPFVVVVVAAAAVAAGLRLLGVA